MGTFCDKDNYDATVELYSLPQFENLKYIIWDFSDVSKMNMTEKETNVASMGDKFATSKLLHTKVALITKDKQTQELCNQYIAQCQNRNIGWKFKVSDSIESIRSWTDS